MFKATSSQVEGQHLNGGLSVACRAQGQIPGYSTGRKAHKWYVLCWFEIKGSVSLSKASVLPGGGCCKWKRFREFAGRSNYLPPIFFV